VAEPNPRDLIGSTLILIATPGRRTRLHLLARPHGTGGLSFCLMCRSFSNTRGREGAGCLRGAQGTYRLGGRSTAEGASVQKTSTSPVAFTKLQVRKRRKRAAAPPRCHIFTHLQIKGGLVTQPSKNACTTVHDRDGGACLTRSCIRDCRR